MHAVGVLRLNDLCRGADLQMGLAQGKQLQPKCCADLLVNRCVRNFTFLINVLLPLTGAMACGQPQERRPFPASPGAAAGDLPAGGKYFNFFVVLLL